MTYVKPFPHYSFNSMEHKHMVTLNKHLSSTHLPTESIKTKSLIRNGIGKLYI